MDKPFVSILCTIPMEDGTFLQAKEDVEKNWGHYSKKWHRTHGPKVTVTNRRVVKMTVDGTEIATVATFERWPSKIKGMMFPSQGYRAILKNIPARKHPLLWGLDINLDEVLKVEFAKGMR